MRLMRIDDVPEFTPLGQSIFDEFGNLLLGAGYPLTKLEISKIRKIGYEFIYVNTPDSEKIAIVPALDPRVESVIHKSLNRQFEKITKLISARKITIVDLSKALEDGSEFENIIDITEAIGAVRTLVEDLELSGMQPLDSYLMKGRITYLADHSINTAIISVLLGYQFGMRRNDLIELALGALFHACGLLVLPQLIGRDEHLLSDLEYQQFKLYPSFSEKILAASTDRFFRSRLTILHHRERQNGTGFPGGLTGTNTKPYLQANPIDHTTIYPMAEIVAVASAFDEYVGRGFGNPMTPEESALNLLARSGHDLNAGVVEAWLNICALFPVGVTVRVLRCPERKWTGGIGIIQKVNWSNAHAPKVVMIKDSTGGELPQVELDLSGYDFSRIRMLI